MFNVSLESYGIYGQLEGRTQNQIGSQNSKDDLSCTEGNQVELEEKNRLGCKPNIFGFTKVLIMKVAIIPPQKEMNSGLQ